MSVSTQLAIAAALFVVMALVAVGIFVYRSRKPPAPPTAMAPILRSVPEANSGRLFLELFESLGRDSAGRLIEARAGEAFASDFFDKFARFAPTVAVPKP